MHLIIDGYNVIKKIKENIQSIENFLNKLIIYKGNRNHQITVVFDGTKSNNPFRTKKNYYGIKVIYSKEGESADNVIKEIVKNAINKNELLVVTSDRELQSFAKSNGCSITSSESLIEKLNYNKKPINISKAEYIEKYIKGYSEEERKITITKRDKRQKQMLWR